MNEVASGGQGFSSRVRLVSVIGGLYLAQSIPMYAFSLAVPAILRKHEVPLSFLGLLGFLLLPWVLKFLWAPLIDRFWFASLGRRRSWLLPSQLILIGGLVALSFLDLAVDYWLVFWIGLVVAIGSATQDAAADGFAVDHLKEKDRALGSAIQGASVGAGVLLGGTGTLVLYDLMGWQWAMSVMAGVTCLVALPVWLLPERQGDAVRQQVPASLFRFFRKPGIASVLALAFVFRLSEGLFKAMEIPFLVDLGFSMSTVGLLSGASGATIGIAGSFLSALAIRRYGIRACLIGLSVARLACYAAFALVASDLGLPRELALVAAMADTAVRYMEIVVLFAFFMRWSVGSQSATDFTVLTSAQLFLYMGGSMVSGYIAEAVGYASLFSLSSGLGLLTLLLVIWLVDRGSGLRPERQIS